MLSFMQVFNRQEVVNMMTFGPRDKKDEITDAEELEIIEAFEEAEEYLETGVVDDFYFDPED